MPKRAVVADLGSSGIELRRNHVECAQFGACGSVGSEGGRRDVDIIFGQRDDGQQGGAHTTFHTLLACSGAAFFARYERRNEIALIRSPMLSSRRIPIPVAKSAPATRAVALVSQISL
jgi:hypothetical protein